MHAEKVELEEEYKQVSACWLRDDCKDIVICNYKMFVAIRQVLSLIGVLGSHVVYK